MRMDLKRIGEPELVFGGGNREKDPKVGLAGFGPIGSQNGDAVAVPIGLVATTDQLPFISDWLGKLGALQIDSERNALKFPEFPGSDERFALHSSSIPDLCEQSLKPSSVCR